MSNRCWTRWDGLSQAIVAFIDLHTLAADFLDDDDDDLGVQGGGASFGGSSAAAATGSIDQLDMFASSQSTIGSRYSAGSSASGTSSHYFGGSGQSAAAAEEVIDKDGDDFVDFDQPKKKARRRPRKSMLD